MIRVLLTVPPRMAEHARGGQEIPSWLRRLTGDPAIPTFIGADPPGARLGSGGGTVSVLHQAWLAEARGRPRPGALERWLGASQKLVLHAGGESRRLPAYAAVGKAFIPVPPLEGLRPRLADPVLADFQLPAYTQALTEAGPGAAALVTSGDVWLDFEATEIPEVRTDLAGIGMRVPPEVAQHFGVFFVERGRHARSGEPQPIDFFLQKPPAAEIARHLATHDAYVDTGMWLLSAAALGLLFARCGWDPRRAAFGGPGGLPGHLDLYTEVGAALGARARVPPRLKALGFSRLTSCVIPLESARFHHLGSSRQLLDSMDQMQRGALRLRRAHRIGSAPGPIVAPELAPTWVEGSAAARPLRLDGWNLVTGLPEGASVRHLQAGACLDVTPVQGGGYAVRAYHLDDAFRGPPGAATLCGQPAAEWLARRRRPAEVDDVQQAPAFPVLTAEEIDQPLVDWFFAAAPEPGLTAALAGHRWLSAAEIPAEADLARYLGERRTRRAAGLRADLEAALAERDGSCLEQDCASLAGICREEPALRRWLSRNGERLLAALPRPEHQSRLAMLLSELSRGRARAAWSEAAFGRLQASMVGPDALAKLRPALSLKEDQIVWARAPVRFDLAGGWTDTPPFCLEAGGTVLNVAVLLNGQPPIQVFVRPTPDPVIRLRSIDLGSAETISTYQELARFRDPRGHFSLPRAALALSGFLPAFQAGRPFRSLRAQLQAFGSGLEFSLLSAVPKGSGLGTSSILAAALLGALNRACGLGLHDVDLYHRVLGVEQLLTTGGGWQDQAGALFPGVKLVETRPGASQAPTVRYLPATLLATGANRTLLLYYTGITRVAKGILQEIVRDMFLGRAATVRTLEAIRANARALFQAVQLGDAAGLERCVARSWRLNQALDAATSTPEIAGVIARCGRDLAACKLVGAGGGGYMVMCARDVAAGQRIRARLEAEPPNPRARFIDFSVAEQGLQVTVS
jgi:galactokinase/mevalonate kinase-like predicted kinase